MSVRIRTPIAPVSDVCPVRHLFLRDSEGRKKWIKNVTGVLAGLSVVCFRQCPRYLECVVMYARYKFCRYTRWATEAGLLFSLRESLILRWKLLLALSISLVNLSVVPVAWRPPPLVFGVELAGLLKYPVVSVGMISWFIGVAVNLAGSVQYPI